MVLLKYCVYLLSNLIIIFRISNTSAIQKCKNRKFATVQNEIYFIKNKKSLFDKKLKVLIIFIITNMINSRKLKFINMITHYNIQILNETKNKETVIIFVARCVFP